MAGLISPVKAPLRSQCMFCAPTLMLWVWVSNSVTFGMAVKGGTITISTVSRSPISRRKVVMKASDSL